MANLIDGKKCAQTLYQKIEKDIKQFSKKFGSLPKLVVVIVGADPASQTYVASKKKKAQALGMESEIIALEENTSQENLLAVIEKLNRDQSVNGILVQLPLPPALDSQAVLSALSPEKDVDGLTPANIGRSTLGLPTLSPCTPSGCVILAKTVEPDLSGLRAVIIGRSVLVGKPLATLLLNENCTVTTAHSKTKNLPQLAAQADLLIAAAGQKHLVKKNWVNASAIVIDVGIHREVVEGKNKLTGDVDFDQVADKVRAITPVPGGVGPMTVACLMENTLRAAFRQKQ
jgi:methylenetetrahydrofolate dehydrogenase (NADP+)/methenyltetrahydrofolate cyclohydrolase